MTEWYVVIVNKVPKIPMEHELISKQGPIVHTLEMWCTCGVPCPTTGKQKNRPFDLDQTAGALLFVWNCANKWMELLTNGDHGHPSSSRR